MPGKPSSSTPLDAVAHGLHKAIDERGLDVGAGGAHDAPGTDGARVQVGQKQGFVLFAQLGLSTLAGACATRRNRSSAPVSPALSILGQHIQADGFAWPSRHARGPGFLFHAVSVWVNKGRLRRRCRPIGLPAGAAQTVALPAAHRCPAKQAAPFCYVGQACRYAAKAAIIPTGLPRPG